MLNQLTANKSVNFAWRIGAHFRRQQIKINKRKQNQHNNNNFIIFKAHFSNPYYVSTDGAPNITDMCVDTHTLLINTKQTHKQISKCDLKHITTQNDKKLYWI